MTATKKPEKPSDRRACRSAFVTGMQRGSQLISRLYNSRNYAQFRNLIRQTRISQADPDAIGTGRLSEHFKAKFARVDSSTDLLRDAEEQVQDMHRATTGVCMKHTFSELRVIRLIKSPKKGCSPGLDGITPEHLFCALNTLVPLLLSVLLTICLRFGRISDSFCAGL
jgi:hypothetical protein